MKEFEIISQIQGGQQRERDGYMEQPLDILNLALTTDFSHDFYPLPLFTLTGAVQARQPNLHGTTLARTGSASEILAYVKQTSPSILALSAPQGTLKTLDEILAGLTRFTPEQRPHLILGGGLPTYLAERFFAKYPRLPMHIIGSWGEDAYAEEVESFSRQSVSPDQRYVLGQYPERYPQQAGVPKKGQVLFHYPRVEASKGCYWGKCIYCLRQLGEEKGKWKQYESNDILAQYQILFDLGYNTDYFEFADEEPIGTKVRRFEQIVDGLAQMRNTNPGFAFGMNMRADHVISPDPDKQQQYDNFLRKAKKAGLTTIWMGAESYSNSHLQALGKGPHVSPEINLKAARRLDNLGINVSQGFIPYHPLSNWQELTEMADFMEPHMSFLARTLGSPFGFLRVQHNTPYLDSIRALDSSTNNHRLLGEFDEDMLTYHCRYQDSSIGLHVAYMRLIYDWINPLMKQMGVETLIGDKMRKNRLDGLRFAGLKLFIRCIRQLEPLKEDLPELERQQLKIISGYKEEISRLGIDVVELDESIQRKLPDYLDKFL